MEITHGKPYWMIATRIENGRKVADVELAPTPRKMMHADARAWLLDNTRGNRFKTKAAAEKALAKMPAHLQRFYGVSEVTPIYF